MRSRAVVLSALMILSIVASPLVGLGAAAQGEQGPPDHAGVPSDKVEIVGSDNSQGGPSSDKKGGPPDHAGPPNGLPDSVPDHAAAWSVGADKHADNLSVSIGTDEDGRLMMTLSDDVNPDGREISVDRETIRSAIGDEPDRVFGEHESGESWSSSISYSGDKATFSVPHFSTNDVVFSGGIVIGETYGDGSQAAYDLEEPEKAGDISLNLTGVFGSEEDTESATGLTSGDDFSVSLAGTENVTGNVTVVPTGEGGYSTNDGGSNYIGQLYGKGTNDEGEYHSSHIFDNPPTTVDNITIDVDEVDYEESEMGTVDVYISKDSSTDTSWREGTRVKNDWQPPTSAGNVTIALDDYSTDGDAVEVELVTNDGWGTYTNTPARASGKSGYFSYETQGDGDTSTEESARMWVNGPPYATDVQASDGHGHSATLGDLNGSTTAELNASIEAEDITFSSTRGYYDVSYTYTEYVETEDPGVKLNGEEVASVDGTLEDGTTESFTVNSSKLVEGENRLNVSMADVSGPAPLVGLDYEHTASAVSAQTDVETSTWREIVNTSHTFPSDQDHADAKIPFSSTTAEIHEVEISVNGSDWEPVDETNLDWDGDSSDLEVYLGDVSEGSEIALRATGRKVQVTNGSIDITDPTIEGDDLATGIEVTGTDADGVSIDVSGTEPDPRIHYLTETSWSSEDYVEQDSAQVLRIPDAHDGATATVKTAPLEVDPVSGGVEVEMLDVDEPRFDLREGNMSGADEIGVTYHDTISGERYVLKNLDRDDLNVDDDVAESPVEFVTDYFGTYTIAQEDEDDDEGGSGVAVTADSGASGLLPLFGGVTGSIVVFALVGRRFLGGESRAARGLLGIGAAVVGYVAAEIATPESLTTSLTYALGDSVGAFASSGAGVVAIGIGLLVAVFVLDRLIPWSIPFPITAISVGLVVLWTIEQIAPGSLSSGLEEVGPVVWLGLIGGGGILIYQWIKSRRPEVTIEGIRS